MPPREPASAAEGLSAQDRLALAKEEGRSPILTPEELVELTYEFEQSRTTPQMAGLLPSRGPVDDPARAFQEPTGPTYDPAMDSPILELVGPLEPPEMVQPPTLHTRKELDAAIGRPEGPPTLSRPPADRGEATMPPDTGQGPQGKLAMLAKIMGVALPLVNAAGRGAAAGEKSGSFLGAWGAASEAEERRQMRQQAHQADQRASAARSGRFEQETALIPEEFEFERQNREITNNLNRASARHFEALSKQIEARLKGTPVSQNRDKILVRMAANLARAEEIKRLRQKGLNPLEAEKAILAAEKMQQEIEATRDLARQRRASAAYDEARTDEVGKPEPEDQNARMRNAATLLNSITRIENDLIGRYKRLDMRPGSPTLNQEVPDIEAMKRDPQYLRLQRLQNYYDAIVSGVVAGPETGSGASPGNPPAGSASPFNFDPNRIRQGVLQRMGAGGVR
jgi:hypothetical protein